MSQVGPGEPDPAQPARRDAIREKRWGFVIVFDLQAFLRLEAAAVVYPASAISNVVPN